MDPYIIIFAALAVVIWLCLYSVLGQRTGSERPFRISAFTYRLSVIAAVLCAVQWVAYKAKWHAAIEAAVTPITTISGPVRVIGGDPVFVGIVLAMALCAAAALALSYLHWKDWKARLPLPSAGNGPAEARPDPIEVTAQGEYLKKAKPLDGLLRDHPSQRKADRVDPRIEREFNNVFMTTSKEGKQALIKRWMDRKNCDREEAMRLAIEELRRDIR